MRTTRFFRISAANIGPNRFHQYRTVSWLMSIPRSDRRSSTLRSDSGYLTYVNTTSLCAAEISRAGLTRRAPGSDLDSLERSPHCQRNSMLCVGLHRQNAGEEAELHRPSIVYRNNDARLHDRRPPGRK